ncbi:MAG: hypothetical protein JWN70_206 [Planctomycetaceae bacterium]|nr:hypothetical protein [Planctomycetaceae bacterium]
MAGNGLKAVGMLIWWYWWRKPVPIRERYAPIKAFICATKMSSKPVWLREKPPEVQQSTSASVTHYCDFHDIRITVLAELSHYSVVHECIHVIIVEEKLPIGWVVHVPGLFESPNHHRMFIGALSNSLHHPAIYSRMETEFRLPMRRYWSRVIADGIQTIDHWYQSPAGPEKKQFDIIAVLFAYLVPELRDICQAYGARYPIEHACCERIRLDVDGVNLNVSEGVHRAIEAISTHLAGYCESYGLFDHAQLWRDLRPITHADLPANWIDGLEVE